MPPLILKPGASITLDFGREITDLIEIFTTLTPGKDMPPLHVRFGESVAETSAEIGERGAQNDHALRDMTVKIPWLGKTSLDPSGFRFVRIDNVDEKISPQIAQI